MKLSPDQAHSRLLASDHGLLGTLHSERGVDVVPVVYAADDDHLAIPIDLVKPKSSSRTQRQRNLEADPRAALTVEHWDREDWSRLWWVRAELRWQAGTDWHEGLAAQLAEGFHQYRDQPFARLLVFDVVSVSGWAASSEPDSPTR